MSKPNKRKRGRPLAEIKRIPIKLSILPDVRQMGGQIALAQNKSLSRFVEDLIREKFNS